MLNLIVARLAFTTSSVGVSSVAERAEKTKAADSASVAATALKRRNFIPGSPSKRSSRTVWEILTHDDAGFSATSATAEFGGLRVSGPGRVFCAPAAADRRKAPVRRLLLGCALIGLFATCGCAVQGPGESGYVAAPPAPAAARIG